MSDGYLLNSRASKPNTRALYAYEALREAIVSGEIKPGTVLNQAKLREELGVSESPIREALRQLAGEGFITYESHIGAVVRSFSRKEMSDILDVRLVLERAALASSLPNLSDSDFSELADLVTEMEAAATSGDFVLYGRLNRAFHMRVYRCSPNAYLTSLLASVWDRSEMARTVFKRFPERMMESLKEHRALFQALKNRDLQTADKLLVSHKRQSFDMGLTEEQ